MIPERKHANRFPTGGAVEAKTTFTHLETVLSIAILGFLGRSGLTGRFERVQKRANALDQ